MWRTVTIAALVGTSWSVAVAQTTDQTIKASFVHNGQEQTITQAEQIDPDLVASFYALPNSCPGLCIAPDEAAPGVQTISERQVIDFVTAYAATGAGLLIDARSPTDRIKGYLPASVNVPAFLLRDENPYKQDILLAMGARKIAGKLNYETAMPILVFDAGPTTTDAVRFITLLIADGYPAGKIKYYRGGMQSWSALGLTIEGRPS